MAEIRTTVSGNMTMLRIIGTPQPEELMAVLDDFYSKKPTRDFVWDFVEGSAQLLTAESVKRLVSFVVSRVHLRAGGKTAIIAPADLEFAVARTLEALFELNSAPFAMHVFRNSKDAAAWFGLESLPAMA